MQQKMKINRIDYPVKVLVIWSEAIGGNREMRDWLMKNGFRELAMFVYGIYNMDEARKWLMDNGFPHFMALLNGIEGKEDAVKWLEQHNFAVMAKVAKAADGYYAERDWLMQNDKLFALIAQRIKYIKDQIHENNSDYHRISI